MNVARQKASASFMESSEASYATTSSKSWEKVAKELKKQGYEGGRQKALLSLLSDYMQKIKGEMKFGALKGLVQDLTKGRCLTSLEML